MRVKDCLWLTIFLVVVLIVTAAIFVRSDSKPSAPLSVAEQIQQLIHRYPVMVFSKSYCPYSRKAKTILSKYRLGENYHVLELDQLTEKAEEYQIELGRLTGASTVPRVFINGKFIGGGDDTAALDQRGELEKLLREAKAIVDK